MTAQSTLSLLKELYGERTILDAPEDVMRYVTSARGKNGKAAFVARPDTTQAVSEIVAICIQNDITLIPQSGNTGLVGGSVPDNTGTQAILSLERLKHPFVLNSYNRSVHVGAGWRLSELNTKLESDNLIFPIDLSADPMIGGMVSTNTGGARFLRHGGVRENTLGIKVVLFNEEGTILDLNTSLHKTNTGPDWKHIFIGSSGLFGIITECTLKLSPRPLQSSVALIIPTAIETIPDLLKQIEHAFGSQLSAFESLSGNAMRHAITHAPNIRSPFQGKLPDMALLVEVSRTWPEKEGESTLEDQLQDTFSDLMISDSPLICDAVFGRQEDFWALRHSLSEGVRQSGQLYAFDLSFERDQVFPFRAYISNRLADKFPQIEICDFGHVGDGGLHFNLLDTSDLPPSSSFIQELREFVFAIAVDKFKGSFSAEHGIGPHNQAIYKQYTPQNIRDLTPAFQLILR